jgi:hypothetical protein
VIIKKYFVRLIETNKYNNMKTALIIMTVLSLTLIGLGQMAFFGYVGIAIVLKVLLILKFAK